MTQNEFLDFFDECSACFPGWSKWVGENSPDVPRTLARWSPILSDVSTAEAVIVLSRWLHGTLPSPKAYEYENFILLVKSVVGLDRARKNSRYESEEKRAEFRKRPYVQNQVMASVSKAYLLMLDEYRKRDAGIISGIEADLAVEEIQRDFGERLSGKV